MKGKESCADVKRKPSYAARKDRREIQVSSHSKPQSAALTATAYLLQPDSKGIQYIHTGIGKSACLGLDAAELKIDECTQILRPRGRGRESEGTRSILMCSNDSRNREVRRGP